MSLVINITRPIKKPIPKAFLELKILYLLSIFNYETPFLGFCLEKYVI